MKLQADFVQFLKNGQLADVRLQMAWSRVVDIMGMPEYWRGKNHGVRIEDAFAYYYGDTTIFFECGLVDTINVAVHFDGERFFDWTRYFASPMQSLERFCESLDGYGVGYQNVQRDVRRWIDVAQLQTEGGVFVGVRRQVNVNYEADGTRNSSFTEPVVDVLVLTVSEWQRWTPLFGPKNAEFKLGFQALRD